jgi:O-antigen/teichoic acid export membrane protein
MIALSAWPLADQMMVSGCNFLTSVVVARVLGPREFGVFTLAWSMVLLGQLLQFCLVTTPMYSLAPSLDETRRPRYFAGLMTWQSLWTMAAGGLLLAGMSLGAVFTRDWPDRHFDVALAAAAAAYLWQDWAKRGLFTLTRSRAAFLSDLLSYPLQLAILGLGLKSGLDLDEVLWIMAGTSGMGALLAGFGLRPLIFTTAELRPIVRQHWLFGRWILGTVPLSWSVANLVLLASGAMLGPEAAAGIRAVSLLFAASNVFFFSLENFVPSRAAQLLQEEGREAFFRFLHQWIGLGMAVGLLIALVAAAAPRFWLTLAFGEAMAPYARLVYPLAVQFPLACYISLVGLLLRAASLTALTFRVWIGMALVGGVTVLPAIRLFGLDGAMGSFVASYAAGAIMITLYARRAPLLLAPIPGEAAHP